MIPRKLGLAGALHLAAFVAFGALSVWRGQDVNWDLKNYHFYNAYAFVHGRMGFDLAPAQLQTYLNPLADLPFYYLVNRLPPRAVGFLLGGVHGLNASLVALIGYKAMTGLPERPRAALSVVCGALGMLGAASWGELGTTFNDALISVFVLASLLLVIDDEPTRPSRSLRAFCAGAVLGAGVGLKLAFAPFAIGLAMAAAATIRPLGRTLALGLWWSFGFLTTFLALAGPWMLFLYQRFGNPTFPQFNHVWRSGWVPSEHYLDLRFVPRDLAHALALPLDLARGIASTAELHFRDARWAVVLGLCVAERLGGLVTGRSHDAGPGVCASHARRVLSVFFVASFVVWLRQFGIQRYLVPLELLAPLFILALLDRLIAHRGVWAGVGLLTLCAVTASVETLDYGRRPWGESFFDVGAPPQATAPGTLVILAEPSDPLAYLIPFFPPSVRFVRPRGNLIDLGSPGRLSREIEEVVRAQRGKIFLLAHRDHGAAVQAALAQFRLAAAGAPIELHAGLDPGLLLHPAVLTQTAGARGAEKPPEP